MLGYYVDIMRLEMAKKLLDLGTFAVIGKAGVKKEWLPDQWKDEDLLEGWNLELGFALVSQWTQMPFVYTSIELRNELALGTFKDPEKLSAATPLYLK